MKSKIYTKTGDQGTTSLVDGTKVSKGNSRIDLYGSIDELNSYLGIVAATCDDLREEIQEIQASLFVLGSNLACPVFKRDELKLPKLPTDLVKKLEKRIDEMESSTGPLSNFILPGGSTSGASFHMARTICRRVERKAIFFEENEPGEIPTGARELLNRLSDYLFAAARYCNHKDGVKEVVWSSSS